MDYASKPIETRELLARVRTHLTIRRQEMQLRAYATQLEQMVEERTRQLIHADRLATLGTFASAIVHEINNPNFSISGYAELIRMHWTSVKPIVTRHVDEETTGKAAKALEKMDEMVDSVLEGSRTIDRRVRQLKAYGRRTDAQMVTCRLADPIADCLHLVNHRAKSGIPITTDIPSDLWLSCDPQKLSQVFVNLCNNAFDAMEGARGQILISAREADGEIHIRVEDSGPGIPDELAAQVFDPFFTTKAKDKGTGLGLYIVRGLVEEHKGQIRLVPSSGGGAVFEIVLPAGRAPE